MPIGRIFGQQSDPRLMAQYQPKAADAKPVYPPYKQRLCQEPNLSKLEYWSDLRGSNLKGYKLSEQFQNTDLSKLYHVLMTCIFDSKTPWPPKEKLPPNFDPDEILKKGMDPGLGIRDLHKQGITGNGVKVAIIDQPPLLGKGQLKHREYGRNPIKYTPVDCEGVSGDLHGPALMSLLAGENCGVAPEAEVYYWGEPQWENNYSQCARAMDQIIEYNNSQTNPEDKIRIVCRSKGYLRDDKRFKNVELWIDALKRAKENGIIVVDCGSGFGTIGCPPDKDKNVPENYDLAYYSRAYWEGSIGSKRIYVPVDNRVFASSTGESDYIFMGDGGLSWSSPYAAGVIALGLQIDPTLDEDTVKTYLYETGTPLIKKIDGKEYDLGRIINPKGFVDRVKLELKNRTQKAK